MSYEENKNVSDNTTEVQPDMQVDFLTSPEVKLTEKEIRDNMKKAAHGDKAAQELLCLARRNEIMQLVYRYIRRGPSEQQLIDVAKKGFIDAICILGRNVDLFGHEKVLEATSNALYIKRNIIKHMTNFVRSRDWDNAYPRPKIVNTNAKPVSSDASKPERIFTVADGNGEEAYNLSELQRRNFSRSRRGKTVEDYRGEIKEKDNTQVEALDREIIELLIEAGEDGVIVTATPEENLVLVKKIIQGDKAAEKQLCLANIRFIAAIAKRYVGYGTEFKELLKEGCDAFIFTVKRGGGEFNKVKTGSFVRSRIKQKLGELVANSKDISSMESYLTMDMIAKHNKAEKELLIELGARPTVAQVAERMGVSEDIAYNIRRITHRSHFESADAERAYRERNAREKAQERRRKEPVEKEKKARLKRDYKKVEMMLFNFSDILTPREQQVLKMRYGIGREKVHTLAEIGNALGVTRERIRQMEVKAIKSLQECQDIVDSVEENRRKAREEEQNRK